MAKISTILKIGGAALLYYGVLRGASALYFGIKSYRFQNISLINNTAEFVVTFTIYNPLLIGLKLKSITGDIYLQGVPCGTINTTYDRYLAGRKTWNISVPVTIDLGQLASAVIQNISTGDINTLYVSFDGSVTVGDNGVMRVPFSKTVTWEDLTK